MKKTLAAVLAAMMALSTATVALAKDTDIGGGADTGDLKEITVAGPDLNTLAYGKTTNFALTLDNDGETYTRTLGRALKSGQVKIDVTVTEGRSLLSKAPTVKVMKDSAGDLYAVLGMPVKHTYSTDIDKDDTDISVRVRVTALHSQDEKDTEWAKNNTIEAITGLEKKGDTLSIDAIDFAAYYEQITAYGKDMTITSTEVADNNVVVVADELLAKLEEKETETATFYFGDTAAFTAKISEAQKDVNVYYALPSVDDYYVEYPELEFEAIEFKAAPKFLRKGTLTFNAIGGEDTVVYEVTEDGLVEMERDEYDSTYETVSYEGINVLTSYLVASEALEVEAEAEVEEPVVEEENPNTGAC